MVKNSNVRKSKCGQKSTLLKNENSVKNQNFVQLSEMLAKNLKFGQKSKF